MLSLFHSRQLAERAIACIRDVPASALGTKPFAREPKIDLYAPIVVPALPDAARTEMKRGRSPLATFRQALRRLEIAAALEVNRARRAFALSKTAVAWLPTR
jgi:hypothetical protein